MGKKVISLSVEESDIPNVLEIKGLKQLLEVRDKEVLEKVL